MIVAIITIPLIAVVMIIMLIQIIFEVNIFHSNHLQTMIILR